MRDVGHRLFQFPVPLLPAPALLPQQAQLVIEPPEQPAGIGVPGGCEGEERVAVLVQPPFQPVPDVLHGPAETIDFSAQIQGQQAQPDTQQPRQHGARSFPFPAF